MYPTLCIRGSFLKGEHIFVHHDQGIIDDRAKFLARKRMRDGRLAPRRLPKAWRNALNPVVVVERFLKKTRERRSADFIVRLCRDLIGLGHAHVVVWLVRWIVYDIVGLVCRLIYERSGGRAGCDGGWYSYHTVRADRSCWSDYYLFRVTNKVSLSAPVIITKEK